MVAATLPVAAIFCLEKGELEGLARGDVAKDLGGADDLAGVVTNGRDAEGDIEAPAILAKTNGFEVIDALAGANPGEDDGLVGLQLVRDEGEDGGADHLLTGVSKDAGGGGIPTGDPAGEVLADDGVVGGFDDSGEFTQALGGVFVTRLGPIQMADFLRELFAKACVLNGDSGLPGYGGDESFRLRTKDVRLLVSVEEAAENFTGLALDGNGEIAADGKLPRGHAEQWDTSCRSGDL